MRKLAGQPPDFDLPFPFEPDLPIPPAKGGEFNFPAAATRLQEAYGVGTSIADSKFKGEIESAADTYERIKQAALPSHLGLQYKYVFGQVIVAEWKSPSTTTAEHDQASNPAAQLNVGPSANPTQLNPVPYTDPTLKLRALRDEIRQLADLPYAPIGPDKVEIEFAKFQTQMHATKTKLNALREEHERSQIGHPSADRSSDTHFPMMRLGLNSKDDAACNWYIELTPRSQDADSRTVSEFTKTITNLTQPGGNLDAKVVQVLREVFNTILAAFRTRIVRDRENEPTLLALEETPVEERPAYFLKRSALCKHPLEALLFFEERLSSQATGPPDVDPAEFKVFMNLLPLATNVLKEVKFDNQQWYSLQPKAMRDAIQKLGVMQEDRTAPREGSGDDTDSVPSMTSSMRDFSFSDSDGSGQRPKKKVRVAEGDDGDAAPMGSSDLHGGAPSVAPGFGVGGSGFQGAQDPLTAGGGTASGASFPRRGGGGGRGPNGPDWPTRRGGRS